MHTYNTTNPPIKLKKYGRNLQNLITHITTIQDKNQQTPYAKALINLMQNISNTKKNYTHTNQLQLLNDIFIISDQKLNLESTQVAPPTPLKKTNKQYTYNTQPIPFKCCGKHLTKLIQTTMQHINNQQTPKERIIALVKLVQNLHKRNQTLPNTLQHIEQVTKQKFPIPHQEMEKFMPQKKAANTNPKRHYYNAPTKKP